MLQFLATLSAAPIATTIFYVSPSGNDTHNGETPTTAFRTISKCAEAVSFPSSSASTTCLVSPGVYREAVELPLLTTNARTFAANPASSSGGGPVVISGAELFPAATTAWTRLAGTSAPIYHTHLALPQGLPRLDQLFVNGSMVHEARWPNAGARFENDAANVVSTKYWSLLQPGSQYGGVVDENLAAASSKSGIDSRPFSWSGATATLNVGEQFYTYTRAVQNHVAGSGLFNYSRDFPGNPPNATWLRWAGMQYFLSGKLEALDAPGEWFHDAAKAMLYLWSPDDASPAHSHVEYKAREYGLFAKHDSQLNVADLTVRGIDFMASTFTFHNCTRCTFRDIALAYPTFNSTIPEQKANGDPAKGTVTRTEVRGDRNTLSRITLKYSPNDGLVIGGTNSQAEDILIEYVDWLGTLDYKPLGLSGTNMTLIKATVGYFGNAGVVTSVPNCLPSGIQVPPLPPPPIPRPMIPARVLQVSYSRIHHGGRVGLDTAGLYSGGWATAGTHWHHNWVHDHREKCVRLDDQSRNATLHHLVAWNCGMGTQGGTQRHAGIGLILKGDGHTVYANVRKE